MLADLWNLSMAGNFRVFDLSSLRKALIFSSILHRNLSFSAFCLSSSLASYSWREIHVRCCFKKTLKLPFVSFSLISPFLKAGQVWTYPWIPLYCKTICWRWHWAVEKKKIITCPEDPWCSDSLLLRLPTLITESQPWKNCELRWKCFRLRSTQ